MAGPYQERAESGSERFRTERCDIEVTYRKGLDFIINTHEITTLFLRRSASSV
jgi:hypothetical protein